MGLGGLSILALFIVRKLNISLAWTGKIGFEK